MKSVCIRQSIWLTVHIERAHICAINRIQCNCGAVYEVVDPKDRARDLNLFKCLVCGKEIISAKAYKVGDLRARVWHRPNQSHSSSSIAPSCRLCDAVICNRNDGYELGCFADVTTNSFNICHAPSTSLSCLASTATKQPDRSRRSRYRN